MEFICYPKCSTCQKAKKWLDENKIEYTERHIVMIILHMMSLRNGMVGVDFRSRDSSIRAACCIRR